MDPRMAAGLLASGIALALLTPSAVPPAARAAARALAVFTVTLGVVTLVERVIHAAGADSGPFVHVLVGETGVPGVLSVGGAASLLLVSAALLTLDSTTRTGRHPAWGLALAGGLVPLQAIVAWLYGVEAHRGESPLTQVSLPAGLALGLLCAGVLLARPEHGFIQVVVSHGSAGFTARRLLAAIALLPIVLGWVFVVAGLRAARYQAMVGVSLVVVSAIVTGVTVVWLTAREVQRTEERRSVVEGALRAEIAQRRRVEEERAELLDRERAARTEAEHASRAKDEFIATLSHELRTPLNSVLGWARLLRTGKLDPAALARAIQAIERGATTQAQIVDDLLDMARIVRGQLRLDARPLDLVPVVEAAIETVRPAAVARDLAIEAMLAPRLPGVLGDPGRLQQVAWNLLTNAIKFTPAGGRVQVRLERRDSAVVLSIRDDGIGIPPDFVPHVFERFRQADSSTTRAHGGLGLGLAIVRHLVEAHGGTVSAHSDGPGQGSTFRVYLPVAPPRVRVRADGPRPSPAPALTPAPMAALQGLRVLVVDDDADTVEVVRELLEISGAEVQVASTVDQALAAISVTRFDVLLSDIGMPVKDGYELIRSVRALPADRGGAIPAAALTSFTQSDHREQALSAGYQLYLAKPIEPGALSFAVARLAGRA
jgi:signal transduction histidine kinase/ActR/RegA family two-component response regulator